MSDRIERELSGPEIQRRVDAWLRDRFDIDQRLASEWREVSSVFGAGSNAARGVLLALVRDAWPDCDVELTITSAGDPILDIQEDGGTRWEIWDAKSPSAALVSALMASPWAAAVFAAEGLERGA